MHSLITAIHSEGDDLWFISLCLNRHGTAWFCSSSYCSFIIPASCHTTSFNLFTRQREREREKEEVHYLGFPWIIMGDGDMKYNPHPCNPHIHMCVWMFFLFCFLKNVSLSFSSTTVSWCLSLHISELYITCKLEIGNACPAVKWCSFIRVIFCPLTSHLNDIQW